MPPERCDFCRFYKPDVRVCVKAEDYGLVNNLFGEEPTRYHACAECRFNRLLKELP